MTSSPQMAARLSARCKGDRAHHPLEGGRAAAAAFYPMPLITEILRGMRDTCDAEDLSQQDLDHELQRQMVVAGLHQDFDLSIAAQLHSEDKLHDSLKRTTTLRMHDGSTRVVPLHETFRATYKDEYTGEQLPAGWVHEAIQDELDYFNQKVWVATPVSEALKEETSKIMGSRWVICNKGDNASPDVRARLVAHMISLQNDSSFYAATPQ